MKFKINISPGMVVATLGLFGLTFSLIDTSGEIGSKIPLSLFFMFILVVGLIYEATPKDRLEGAFGEVQPGKGFG